MKLVEMQLKKQTAIVSNILKSFSRFAIARAVRLCTACYIPSNSWPVQVRQQVLKREEDALQRERERLEREKYKHIRSLKRLRDQNMSKFRKFPRMGSRQQYVLFSLLGKGGFSEVYKVRT